MQKDYDSQDLLYKTQLHKFMRCLLVSLLLFSFTTSLATDKVYADKINNATELDAFEELFPIMTNPNRPKYVFTNDFDQINTSQDATKACTMRWKIEQYHREVKQTTGIGKCRARNGKAQPKHINVAILTGLVFSTQAHAIKNYLRIEGGTS